MNLRTTPGRHFVHGGIGVFLAEALSLPTGLITVAFLTRRLGPEGYGLLTLVTMLVVWVEWGIVSLFSRATVKLVSEAEDWRPVGAVTLRLHLVTGGGAALLLWLLAVPVAAVLAEPALAGNLRLFALGIPLISLVHAHQSLLVGTGRFIQRAVAGASRWIARLLLIVLLVELGLSVPGVILGTIGASLVELAIVRFYIRPSLSHRSPQRTRQVWIYAAPLFLSALSLRLFDRLDLLALKALGGTIEQAGIYGAAQNLSMVPRIFALSLSPLLLATLGHMVRIGDHLPAKAMGRDAMRAVILLLPFAGMVAGAAPEVVGLVFGSRYLPAAPLLAILIFGALALVMISVGTAVLIAAGKPGWALALSWPLVPFAIVGHLLLIPRLGAIGAATVTTLCAILAALAAVLAVYRIWRILPPRATSWRSLVLCGASYGLAGLWPAPGLWLLFKLPAIGLGVAAAFLLTGEFNTGEIALVRSVLLRAVRRRA